MPEADVWVFGSRAKWLARDTSDLDLCIRSADPIGFSRMGSLRVAFEESNLPYKVDVLDWATAAPSFRKIIERDKVKIQKRIAVGRVSASVTRQIADDAENANVGLRDKTANPTYGARQSVSLDSICSLIADCPHSTPVWTDTGFLVIRNQNIKNGKLDLAQRSYTDLEHYLIRVRRAKPQGGDLIMTREAPMGDVCMVPDGLECCVGQRQVLLRPNPEKVIPRFLLYAIQSPEVQHEISWSEGTGSTVSNIRIPVLKNIKVPLLPLNEQLEISTLLGALDDRITLLRASNATLEAIAKALFKSWFVDFDPVRAKQEGRAPEGMSDAIAALFPDSFEESAVGLVPMGWEIKSLGDLLVPKRGKSITKSKCTDGDIPVVAGGLEPAYFHNQSNVCSPVVTVSASGANAGFVRLYQQNIWASDCSFVSAEQTDAIFFWYAFLKFNQEKIYSMQQGAAQPHISPSDLMRLSICTPKPSVMRNIFNLLVAPLFERIGLANSKIQTLTTLRDTLLPRLISGKLRLPEAEALLTA